MTSSVSSARHTTALAASLQRWERCSAGLRTPGIADAHSAPVHAGPAIEPAGRQARRTQVPASVGKPAVVPEVP